MAQFTRSPLSQSLISDKFSIAKKEYLQYNHLYNSRLEAMRGRLSTYITEKWELNAPTSNIKYSNRIIDCESFPGQLFVLIGTIFKQMPQKPSVIKLTKDFIMQINVILLIIRFLTN